MAARYNHHAADGQQLPIRAPGRRLVADLRPPVREHLTCLRVQDHNAGRSPIPVGDRESPALGVERQMAGCEIQRQPPDSFPLRLPSRNRPALRRQSRMEKRAGTITAGAQAAGLVARVGDAFPASVLHTRRSWRSI